jgi:glycerophosphoryl diester phosphodiesterase
MAPSMSERWLRIAHRGASGLAPEHTRAAFERALDYAVDMIELDVQLSRDGELVVIHDLDLQRTTTGHGAVRQHDFAVLKSLDAGSWFAREFAGERVLGLAEVIEVVGTRARLNVEIKAAAVDWPALMPRLVDTLRVHDILEQTILSAFEPTALAAVREQTPQARVGLLWLPELGEIWPLLDTLDARSLHLHWTLVSEEVVQHAHSRGVDVLAWTVNDVDTMRALVRMGVDGIMSDFPDRFGSVSA